MMKDRGVHESSKSVNTEEIVISLNIYFCAIYHFYADKTPLLLLFAENPLQSYFMFKKLALDLLI